MDEDRIENHLPLCKRPTDVEIKQTDLCKVYIDAMRKMSDIPDNADPRTVAFIFISRRHACFFYVRAIFVFFATAFFLMFYG